MKRISYRFAGPVQLVMASTALFASIAFAGPLPGTPMVLADANSEQAPSPPPAITHKSSKASDPAEGIDGLIAHLHKELKITAAQETLWGNVVQVMRDNADKLSSLMKARSDSAKTATAIDDLKSYEVISEAHEDGTKKLIPVFQALYDSMSDDQKKAADTEFREHSHHHVHTH